MKKGPCLGNDVSDLNAFRQHKYWNLTVFFFDDVWLVVSRLEDKSQSADICGVDRKCGFHEGGNIAWCIAAKALSDRILDLMLKVEISNPTISMKSLFLILTFLLHYLSFIGTSSTKDAGNMPIFPLHCPSNQSSLTEKKVMKMGVLYFKTTVGYSSSRISSNNRIINTDNRFLHCWNGALHERN